MFCFSSSILLFFPCVCVCLQADRTEKHKWKRAKCNHVQENAKKKKNGEADSFRNMKLKISYTLEDGHVGRNMQCKTVTTKCKTVKHLQ
jgi:hypothetical protein